MVYCLLLEDDTDKVKHRAEVDAKLVEVGSAGRTPDRATWGLLPHQREATKRGMTGAAARPLAGHRRNGRGE